MDGGGARFTQSTNVFLGTYYVPGVILGAEDPAMGLMALIPSGKTEDKQGVNTFTCQQN